MTSNTLTDSEVYAELCFEMTKAKKLDLNLK